MTADDKKRRDGPEYGTWISREEQQSMHIDRRGEGKGARNEEGRQQGRDGNRNEAQQQGGLFGEDDRQFKGEETPGREMQERHRLVDENRLEEQRRDDWEPREDLSKDPEDDHRKIREQQDRLRQQGEPRTREEKLGSGWADSEDPSQAMDEDTIDEDEENLADKRT